MSSLRRLLRVWIGPSYGLRPLRVLRATLKTRHHRLPVETNSSLVGRFAGGAFKSVMDFISRFAHHATAMPVFYDTHAQLDYPDDAPDFPAVLAHAAATGIAKSIALA